MPIPRKEVHGGRAFAFPLFGIVVLLACYALLADWQELPTIIDSIRSAVHWPI